MEATENTAISAERGILSSIVKGQPSGIFWPAYLNMNFFIDSRHKCIYSAIEHICAQGIQPDWLLVQEKLIRSGLLEAAGGKEYLTTLDKPVATVAQFESYVSIIKNYSMKMALVDVGEQLIAYGRIASGDPKDDWERARADMNRVELLFDAGSLPNISSDIDEFLAELELHVRQEKPTTGLSTGLEKLDEVIGGFGKGELIIVGARPAMGKTGFMLSSILSLILEQQLPIVWFSLELSTNQLVTRLLSIAARVESDKIRRGRLSESEKSAVLAASGQLKTAPFYVVDEVALSPERVALLARKMKDLHGVQMIVIDYLQLISHPRGSRSASREIQVAEICRLLKRLARELNIPVVVLSQLSRAVEHRGGDKKPILSDLRESGAIEQDADKVLFLYRAEYYGIDIDQDGSDTQGVAEIIVAKNRFGPVGNARVRFIPRLACFEDGEAGERMLLPDEIPIADERLREKFKRVFLQQEENDSESPF